LHSALGLTLLENCAARRLKIQDRKMWKQYLKNQIERVENEADKHSEHNSHGTACSDPSFSTRKQVEK